MSCYFLYFDALTFVALLTLVGLPLPRPTKWYKQETTQPGATSQRQANQSRALTSNSGLPFPYLNHPWTKYQTTRASTHTLEPAEINQTNQC